MEFQVRLWFSWNASSMCLEYFDKQEIIMFLQSLPTQDWDDKNTELLLSEAFVWKSLFHDAQGHFVRK
jgi:TBC1 domain family member 2